MKLQDWIDQNLLTISEFAKQLGVPRQTIHKYLRGKKARRYIAFKIEKFTGGQVKASSLIEGIEAKNDLYLNTRRSDTVEEGGP